MKEKLDKFTCDRCGEVLEFKHKLIVSRIPEGWGHDLQKRDLFCEKCKTSYDKGYTNWYEEWLKGVE